eukprot:gb/GECG01002135.1/.p1 GENE.gb/GECG01002135.1/~~gb/GECG01002135.1/.p1  ORF type:complete len:279 (+),score=30.36 gb/GECG01002135.1/:1-837(+)
MSSKESSHPSQSTSGSHCTEIPSHTGSSVPNEGPKAKYRKTAVCFEWERSGTCKHGDKCRFAHGTQELRERNVHGKATTIGDQKALVRNSQSVTLRGAPMAAASGEGDHVTRFGSLTERYYARMIGKDCSDVQGNDVYVFQHSNKLCLIGLARKHPMLAQNKTVVAVKPSEATQQAISSAVSGKKKKDGLAVKHTQEMCRIRCEDGSEYGIPFMVDGKLIEWNATLESAPQACAIHSEGMGYLALIEPKLAGIGKLYDRLVSFEHYMNENSDVASMES